MIKILRHLMTLFSSFLPALLVAQIEGQGLRSIKERYGRMGWSGEWVSPATGCGTEFRLSGKLD